jgi:hypothetical protein
LQTDAVTRLFTEDVLEGRDRIAAVRSHPGYILPAYWGWLLMGSQRRHPLWQHLMVVVERHGLGLVLLLLTPHLYSIATRVLVSSGAARSEHDHV